MDKLEYDIWVETSRCDTFDIRVVGRLINILGEVSTGTAAAGGVSWYQVTRVVVAGDARQTTDAARSTS